MFKKRKNKAPYLKHYCRGMTDRQIAEATGRSACTVHLWRKRNNLPPNPKGAIRSQREARLFFAPAAEEYMGGDVDGMENHAGGC